MLPRTLHRPATKIALGALVGVCALGASAYAFGTPFRGSRDEGRRQAPAALTIRAADKRPALVPGRSVEVRVAVNRGPALIQPPARNRPRLAAPISLSVDRPTARGVRAAVSPRTTRSAATTLTLKALDSTRPGTYRVRVRARGRLFPGPQYRLHEAETVVTFVVSKPQAATRTLKFGIAGAVSGQLSPGVSLPVDLSLQNPHGSPLKISRLTVAIGAIRAPRADAGHPCTAADFTVAQFSGAYRVVVPASSRRTLSGLGIPRAQWPRITLSNRPVNQDGCQQATVALKFSGTGVGGQK